MRQQNLKQSRWWQTVFDDKYLKTYVDVFDHGTTIKQIDFLEKKLRLQKKQKILDLACGQGRHTIELTKRGYKVIGLDYSNHLLNIAQQKAREENLSIEFIQGDMKNLPFKNEFDVIINMYTSFGYFEKEEDNISVLESINHALKKNGKFLIDLNNSMRLIANIIQNGVKDKKSGFFVLKQKKQLSNKIVVATENTFNPIDMRWLMKRSWQENDKIDQYKSSVRLFSLPELKYLLQTNNFKVKQIWGDFDGQNFNPESPRLIILFEKINIPH